MVVEKEKIQMRWMSHRVCLRVLWMMIGVVIMGGVYFLSHNNVDEVVINESRTIIEFMRTVLTK